MTGRDLRELRLRVGLTQQALAVRLGVSLRTILRIESGETRKPSPLLLRRIREEFSDLLGR